MKRKSGDFPGVTFTLMGLCLMMLFATGTTSCDGSLAEWDAQVEIELERVAGEDLEPDLPLNAYQK